MRQSPVLACLAVLTLIAACGRNAGDAPGAPDLVEISDAPVSDELPGLPAPATGIAFWDHPTLSFNSTLIVATSAGIVAYNMEDGNEAARIDGFNADGVATGYLGLGPQAAGFLAFLDADAGAFRFYGIDNNTRTFLPIEGGPAIRGAVRDFCMGRGLGADAPSLFVVQNSEVQVFNLAAADDGVAVESEATLETPDNLVSCAVDIDGRLLVASDAGALYRIASEDAFNTPLAQTGTKGAGALAVVAARLVSGDPDEPPVSTGQILFTDLSSGAVHVFESLTGDSQGSVRIAATDDLSGVDAADVFSATGANLGGLYRNGAIAFGVADGEDGPVIRIAPVSGVRNARSIPVGDPVSLRGRAPTPEDEGLIINPGFTPQ